MTTADHDVRAVVFDMDGLMLDTEPIYKVAWQAAAAVLGYAIDDAVYATFVGRPNDDCERELAERFGPGFPFDRFRARWPPLWRAEAATRGIRKMEGLLDLLAWLDSRGIPMAVATSTGAEDAAFTLRSARLESRFRAVVTGDQVTHGKPAPDIYVEAARRLGVAPTRCVALEDSEAGIVSASRAGTLALLITNGTEPSGAARNAAACALPSLIDARDVIRRLVDGKENGRR
jgi:HAD superfamily hydrolase (TIGR01509 family)